MMKSTVNQPPPWIDSTGFRAGHRRKHGGAPMERVARCEAPEEPGVAKSRKRSGWSLIEMMVSISVSAIFAGVALKLIATLLMAEHNGVQHVTELTSLARLSRQFRQDLHTAQSFVLAPTADAGSADTSSKGPSQLFEVSAANGVTVKYAIEAGVLQRTEQRPNRSPIHQQWRMEEATFRCTESAGPPRLVTMVVALRRFNPLAQTAEKARMFQFEAVVERDRSEESSATTAAPVATDGPPANPAPEKLAPPGALDESGPPAPALPESTDGTSQLENP